MGLRVSVHNTGCTLHMEISNEVAFSVCNDERVTSQLSDDQRGAEPTGVGRTLCAGCPSL